ncbi:MAG: ISAzo13 family transposase [Desulfobacterales bacterium]|nr:ISAzo13 family transposase [Desulfobacterales bacterium]MDD4073443.1 ISAzo13 family transposase [Desulfobacterales bacterium]
MLKYETAGNPINGLKWTRKTTEKIAIELSYVGIQVSANTVGRLLKKMGYSVRVNCKTIESGMKNPPEPELRDKQFGHISDLREKFAKRGNPIISVDTKKKELIGNFKNQGATWQQTATEVKDHDFPSDAIGKAIPYGIYDTQQNSGTVFLATSHDTPAFAVECIETWWKTQGKKQYSNSNEILILADSGGSNSYRSRVWKCRIQSKLCDQYGLTVFVSHYPPGSSKWNPIEHRLFSEISKNWAGRPLDSYETTLKYIRTTKTSSGLKVKAHFVRKKYATGERIPDRQMKELSIEKHEGLPNWNYTLKPA